MTGTINPRWLLVVGGLACLGVASRAGAADHDRKHSPRPTQVWWTDRQGILLVQESGTWRITEFDVKTLQALRTTSLPFDPMTCRIAVGAPGGAWSAAIDPGLAIVTFLDGDIWKTGNQDRKPTHLPDSVAVDANPQALALTPDSKTLLVACDATGPADRRVCIIDIENGKSTFRVIKGSSGLRGIAVDPQGKYALAVHLVPKSHLPSTQIEQGWVFTNAISFLSLSGPACTVTLPLDLRTMGFANPEGVAITPDGTKAYVAHAGADVVSAIDLPALLALVESTKTTRGGRSQRDPSGAANIIVDDLRVTSRYVRQRIPVGANPRAIAVSPDGRQVAVGNRLDASVSIIDTAADAVIETVSLVGADKSPLESQDRVLLEGERLFHSGRLSFGGQFSCASCHPEGHADGLNWDLPADGFNNFHNTKSLLGNASTAPYGWLGSSPTLRDRFTGTLRHLFQHEPSESEAAALEAYLSHLPLPDCATAPTGERLSAITRGKSLFEGAAGCTACHSGPKLTDRKLHSIGSGSDREPEFDTPALLRISTTAPYLHDGRAATLEEVFTRHNAAGLHGRAADLSTEQLDDLVAFLKSL